MFILLGNSLAPTLRDYFTSRVTDEKNLKLLPASLGKFVSGEAFAEPQISPNDLKGQPVTIIQSMATVGDHTPQDFLWQTLMTIRKLKEKGAGPIWVVMPFAPYGRQDREFDDRMTSVAIDDLGFFLKQAGAIGVSTVELHSEAGLNLLRDNHFGEQNVFNLDPTDLFAQHIENSMNTSDVVVGGPDDGAHLRAKTLAHKLGAKSFAFKKHHTGVNETEVIGFEGDVKNKDSATVDDMVDTGGTLENSQLDLADHGAKSRHVYTTHGILSLDALNRLFSAKTRDGSEYAITRLVLSDTIDISDKLTSLRRQYGEQAVAKRVVQTSTGSMLCDHIVKDIMAHPAMAHEREVA